MTVTSLSETIGNMLKEISQRRDEIKEAYIKAWLAANVPDEKLNLDWIINNLSIQEKWSADRMTCTWSLVMKESHGS